jgi:cleavage stimulation factor subunit 2
MDRDTGKPKGFGFCEFHSKEDAESAYRNLNNTMFKNRQIRIDFAEENISDRVGYKPRGKWQDAQGAVSWQQRQPAGAASSASSISSRGVAKQLM